MNIKVLLLVLGVTEISLAEPHQVTPHLSAAATLVGDTTDSVDSSNAFVNLWIGVGAATLSPSRTGGAFAATGFEFEFREADGEKPTAEIFSVTRVGVSGYSSEQRLHWVAMASVYLFAGIRMRGVDDATVVRHGVGFSLPVLFMTRLPLPTTVDTGFDHDWQNSTVTRWFVRVGFGF